MSTYATNPYTLSQLDMPDRDASITCNQIHNAMLRVRNAFSESGWDVTDVPPIMTTVTSDTIPIPICLLGLDEVVFYNVAVGSENLLVVDGSFYDCCLESDPCDCLTATTAQFFPTPYGNVSNRIALNLTMQTVLRVLFTKNGSILLADEAYSSSDPDDNNIYNDYYLTDGDNCAPTIVFGGQHHMSIQGPSQVRGAGFIARSQDSIVANNKLELYCTYVFDGVDSYLRLYYRKGGWPDFSVSVSPLTTDIGIVCPNETVTIFELGSKFGTHPIKVLEDEDEAPKIQALDITLIGEQMNFWINDYCAFYTPSEAPSGLSASGFVGALKIKRLEKETTPLPNIRKLLMALGRINGGESIRETNSVTTTGAFLEIETISGSVTSKVNPAGEYGPFLLNSLSDTWDYSRVREGIQWYGGVAEIAEPWVAGNFYTQDENSLAPVVGQVWDCMTPYRAVSAGTDIPTPFTWDGELWRYVQTNKLRASGAYPDVIGPPSSMALRVKDFRIFNGEGYSGEEQVEIVSVSADPNPVDPTANTIIITVVIVPTNNGDGGFVAVYTKDDHRINFTSNIITYTKGKSSASISANIIKLELPVEETVTITAKSENVKTTTVVFEKYGS